MTPFLRRVLRVGLIVMSGLARVWERIPALFRSKAGAARCAAERFEVVRRRELGVERLDRLRHPENYRGRKTRHFTSPSADHSEAQEYQSSGGFAEGLQPR